MFGQVSGLGDRRSRVQISAARPIDPQVGDCFCPLVLRRLEALVTSRSSNDNPRLRKIPTPLRSSNLTPWTNTTNGTFTMPFARLNRTG